MDKDLKEIADGLRNTLLNNGPQIACEEIAKSIHAAHSLGTPVSAKEYAVEVLLKLLKDIQSFPSPVLDAEGLNRYNHGLLIPQSLIQSTITELKSQPSSNTGIHKWIAIEQEMPENGKRVFIYWQNENGKSRTSTGWYVAKHTMVAEDDFGHQDDWAEYDEVSDEWYWPEGWYEVGWELEQCAPIKGVTHWLPKSVLGTPEMPSPPSDN